jgi:hypothetical protein
MSSKRDGRVGYLKAFLLEPGLPLLDNLHAYDVDSADDGIVIFCYGRERESDKLFPFFCS